MNDLLLFVTGPLPGRALPAAYDPGLVALSYIVASLAAYTAIDLAGRVSEFRAEPRRAAAWLIGGAFAMGAGIWSMHFVAMLAYQLPIPVRFEPWTTLASMVAAIATSGFALYIVTRGTLSWRRLLVSGAVMGAGIGTMHYTGMAAMRLDALVMYYITPWLLSIVNAIVCSTIAIWLVFRLGGTGLISKVLAALVMGVAIAGMHYTGMYATVCVSTGQAAVAATGLDPVLLALAIGVVTLLIMTMALTVSLQSQLTSHTLRQQNELLKVEVEQRRTAEAELQHHRDNLQALVDERTRELSQANVELRGSEGRKGAMLESALDCVICMDSNGMITEFNPAAEATFGYSRADVVGRELASTIAPQSQREAHRRGLQHYVATGEGPILGRRRELTALRADGTEFPIELAVSAIQVNHVPMFAAYLRDITERKRSEQELQTTKEAAEAASRAKSEFLATMSHEIRTPMNGVLGMTELLLGTQLDARQRRFAETAHRSGVALLSIINDILDFSKIEAGKVELRTRPFDLRELVEEVADTLAEEARRKKLEFNCLIPAAVPTRVQGSPVWLRQVLINLAGNAIKYTERGEVMVRVAATEETADAVLLRFEVKDTGIGIADDQLERIFEPFTQAKGQSRRKYGGTGLGLSICKQLVEKMGGEIGVVSVPGASSTFWFKLRVMKQPADAAAAAGAERPMLGLRALIVDDNATNREILGHQLAAAGVDHDQADAGARALEKLRAAASQGKRFGIAVTDDDMPGMDGIELARAIRADPLLAATPLIMLSSAGRDEHAAREAGIEYCLTRPVRQSQLFDCLVSAMAGTTPAAAVRQAPGAANLQAHVLLVEDNPVNQELALQMLEVLGCRAVVANHGREALEALDRTAFDLILMDCQMPEMDGFEATAEIRRREAVQTNGRRIPIIALTAGAVEGDREKCLAEGMDDYVTKPFSLDQLERALRRWLPAECKAQTGAPCIDLQVLERMRALRGNGGTDLVTRIISVYLKDAPGRLRSLQEAVAQGDTVAMGRTAHAFKSASANLGAASLAKLCQRMESLGRASSTGGADGLLAEIDAEYAQVAAELSAHAGNIGS